MKESPIEFSTVSDFSGDYASDYTSEIFYSSQPAVENPADTTEASASSESETKADTVSGETFYKETIKNDPFKPKKSFRRGVAIACIVSILGGLFGGIGIGAGGRIAIDYLIPRLTGKAQVSSGDRMAFNFSDFKPVVFSEEFLNGSAALSDIVNLVEPSVVSITSTVMSEATFFNSAVEVPELGSGIIFHEDDKKIYVATNNHVIERASSVDVSISGSNPLPAKLVGADAQSDLAVISVDKTVLEEAGINQIVLANFGDSDAMNVGDLVLAIGNAFGAGNTATQGIVSAKDKTINVQGKVLEVIQTDAAINPGNSGGPLVNMKGEIIGINTAKLSQSNVEGMGYSITSNVAKPIIEDLMNRLTKPFLGVQGQNVTEEMAAMYNLPEIGVYVASVIPGSSAEKAGIQRTDIIIGFKDQPVMTMDQLKEAISKCAVGEKVEIKLIRNGKDSLTIEVELFEYSEVNF